MKAWKLECKKANSNLKKEEEKALKEKEEAENRAKILEEAKAIKIVEDVTKPVAKLSKIIRLESFRGQRVKVKGWVVRLRREGNFTCFNFYFLKIINLFILGKALMFMTLRDGTGFLQCVLSDKLCQTYEALILTTGINSFQF
jgi:asparaginyl-tRNA synthetase